MRIKRWTKILLPFTFPLCVASCKTIPVTGSTSKVNAASPEPEQFKETIAPDESRLIEQSIAVTRDKIHKEIQPDGVLRRDAHPKHHGCVRGTFTVLEDIPEEAKFGVFAKSASWPIWARFSNASLIPKTLDDRVPDARGMAFKLIGVPGPKLLPHQETSTNLDFTMVNIPFFLARDIGEYNEQLTNATYALTHPRFALLLARAVSRRVEDPLHEHYFSIGASKLGSRAAKFRVKPCDDRPIKNLATSGPSFLKDAMKKHLEAQDACFDFQVQFQVTGSTGFQDDKKTPIEDVTIVWEERDAPFVSIARVTIPRTGITASGKAYDNQAFDNQKQQNFCENMSFNPWRTLAEHRPLGTLNRARKHVYAAISKHRHEVNKAPMLETDGEEVFP